LLVCNGDGDRFHDCHFSAQAEERQDEHDHDDQANNVDHAIHGAYPLESKSGLRVVARPALQEPAAEKKVPVFSICCLQSRVVLTSDRTIRLE
jgi:hypothetical protein